MIYWILYIMMLIGFTGLGVLSPSVKFKVIGLLLAIVNGLIFFKGN